MMVAWLEPPLKAWLKMLLRMAWSVDRHNCFCTSHLRNKNACLLAPMLTSGAWGWREPMASSLAKRFSNNYIYPLSANFLFTEGNIQDQRNDTTNQHRHKPNSSAWPPSVTTHSNITLYGITDPDLIETVYHRSFLKDGENASLKCWPQKIREFCPFICWRNKAVRIECNNGTFCQ